MRRSTGHSVGQATGSMSQAQTLLTWAAASAPSLRFPARPSGNSERLARYARGAGATMRGLTVHVAAGHRGLQREALIREDKERRQRTEVPLAVPARQLGTGEKIGLEELARAASARASALTLSEQCTDISARAAQMARFA
eukprot:1209028-Prymnesium_polylepis.1